MQRSTWSRTRLIRDDAPDPPLTPVDFDEPPVVADNLAVEVAFATQASCDDSLELTRFDGHLTNPRLRAEVFDDQVTKDASRFHTGVQG